MSKINTDQGSGHNVLLVDLREPYSPNEINLLGKTIIKKSIFAERQRIQEKKKEKSTNTKPLWHYMIVAQSEEGVKVIGVRNVITFRMLFEDYVFSSGMPCGKRARTDVGK